ncbi:MAG: polysulfide reductase NrfD [Nitrospinota bacterium]|nr:polysulfide reductase NrfD [Nitrospinota bacterium]MDP7371704.1 polysulfide reductase NrfD [Nitrospinota bacterium]MDP7504312.1 polysulfide reductase NrfD [Nitrospinota bacterium]MDP7665065.1 polysulfide reductase NrfD [Nitrospinota bacterium]HJP12870.1 4Fe-4S dicluster domain-containing protein [Nitrospinota bacterium]
MARYGMAIDLSQCIGCHACTIACKSEHEIPIGVWRCWVKEVEKGYFPDTRREFLPVLCNQCSAAPCRSICPTGALFRRPDGIVDLDPSWCIGCKACMVACPYDQLFIDPNTNTAEKCNFCSNRLEAGLEPACVVVCPTQCRIFGDREDADSRLSGLIAREAVTVRKAEYNTSPNIYYFKGSRQTLDPTAAGQSGIYKQGEADEQTQDMVPEWENKPGESRTVYDVFHNIPWDRKIIGYLMMKGLSAGLLILALIMWRLGYESSLFAIWAPILSGILLAATGALLVTDLKRPERFYYILIRPNWGSWMSLGTYFIALDGVLTALWVLGALAGSRGALETLLWPTLAAAALTSIYTGFFFAQAAARDLWRGSENTVDIAAQTVVKGAAGLIFFTTIFPVADKIPALLFLGSVLTGALLVHLAILIFSTLAHRTGPAALERAVALLVDGPLKNEFWGGAIAMGCAVPVILIWWCGVGGMGALTAAILAVAGAYYWDRVWVKAGQAVPLS